MTQHELYRLTPGPELDAVVYRILVSRKGWRITGGCLFKPNGDCPDANRSFAPSLYLDCAFDLVKEVRATFELWSPLWRRDGPMPFEATFEGVIAGGASPAEAITRAFISLYELDEE